jgi:endonuclease YncB( thermonuclease family)
MDYNYDVKVDRVVDGDTVWFHVDLGFGIWARLDFRIAGINTPEIVGVQKASGLVSKAELERLLSLGSIRIISRKTEKYGRWLATIYVKQADGTEICVNDVMISGGFAKQYDGDGPKPT